jgi:flagellar L-ring protein precursor FlgH
VTASRRTACLLTLVGVLPLLAACSIPEQLSRIGQAPDLSPIDNPVRQPGYQPVSLPMPDAEPQVSAGANSLWRSGARSFFRDQRARRVGDILTVQVTVDDAATLSNTSTRSRRSGDQLGVPGLFGLENVLTKVLPKSEDGTAVDPSNLVEMEGRASNEGRGGVTRSEKVTMNLAAVITQVLPNGNLVIQGKQEIRVNFELREIQVAGIVRPEDITPRNTIGHEKIAELRVTYGGRGQITDFQQPPYGAQLLGVLRPY